MVSRLARVQTVGYTHAEKQTVQEIKLLIRNWGIAVANSR